MLRSSSILFEKKALRVLPADEAAWVRQHCPGRIIFSTFALKWKQEADGNKKNPRTAKARMALRGDQDPDVWDIVFDGQTQSPTLSQERCHSLKCARLCFCQ